MRGLRNEDFVLKTGKGQVVCGSEKVVEEICDALAAADSNLEMSLEVRLPPS